MAERRALAALPRLLTAAPRLVSPAPETEAERDRYRNDFQPWRAWYKTARWRKLREAILLRDRYTCQATGALLIGKYPAPNSPVVDHRKPHRGDETLFWDPGNLQAVSKEYHDQAKQSLEKRGLAG